MTGRYRAVPLVLAAVVLVAGHGTAAPVRPEARTVVTGARDLAGIAFTSDGRLVFIEGDHVRIIQDGELRAEPIASFADGLAAVAAPPDTAVDPALYVAGNPNPNGEAAAFRVPLDLSRVRRVVDDLPAVRGLAVGAFPQLIASPAALAIEPYSGIIVTSGNYDPAIRSLSEGPPPTVPAPRVVHPDALPEASALAFAPPGEAVAGYDHALFYAVGTTVRTTRWIRSGHLARDRVLVDAGAPVVALTWGPDGLYVATSTAISVVPLARSAGTSEPEPVITATPVGDDPDVTSPGSRIVFVVMTIAFVAVWLAGRKRLLS